MTDSLFPGVFVWDSEHQFLSIHDTIILCIPHHPQLSLFQTAVFTLSMTMLSFPWLSFLVAFLSTFSKAEVTNHGFIQSQNSYIVFCIIFLKMPKIWVPLLTAGRHCCFNGATCKSSRTSWVVKTSLKSIILCVKWGWFFPCTSLFF